MTTATTSQAADIVTRTMNMSVQLGTHPYLFGIVKENWYGT